MELIALKLIFILLMVSRYEVKSVHLQGPVFLTEPPPIVMIVNNSQGVLIDCIGQGIPLPTVQWLDQEHRPILEVPRIREILSNGSLYFPPFQIADYRRDVHAATYICSISNVVGRIISRQCKLKSDTTAPFKVEVKNIIATPSNTGFFKCFATTSVEEDLLQTSWMKEDEVTKSKSIIQTGGKYAITIGGDLHIRDIGQTDSDVKYSCKITNKLTGNSVESNAASILVRAADTHGNFPPKIEHSSPDEVFVKSGHAVDLSCVAHGFPRPTYRWYREVDNVLQEIHSISIMLRTLDTILHFPHVQPSDSAYYVCIVTNSLGEDRKRIKLNVISDIIVFVRPQKQVIDSGSSAMFNCSVHHNGRHISITWLKNGHHLSGKFSILNDGELLALNSVAREDSGMYQCYVHSNEETAQSSAELQLGAVSPELKQVFVEQVLQPGSSVSLKCVAGGNPHSRIFWNLDGGLLYPQGDYILGSYMDENGDVVSHLNITYIRIHHGGLYSCIARNILGSTQHSAFINVYGSPVSRQPLNLTVVSGIDVYLRCPASGYPIETTTWQYGGKKIFSGLKHELFDNGTLLVKGVNRAQDQGNYKCTITNKLGQSALGQLYLNIMEPPEVQPFQFDKDLKEGNRAHVSCTIKSGDLPIEFNWRKNHAPLPHDVDVQQQNLQFVSNLYFSKLSAKHSGHYTCIVSNAVAVANFTAYLRIKVSPTWTMEPQDVSVLQKQMAVLNCQADGFPPPKVSWLKATDVEMGVHHPIDLSYNTYVSENGSLIIKHADRHHAGYYKCAVENGIGSGLSKVVSLKVNVPAHFLEKYMNQSGVAGEKIILTCEAEGDLPMRITWSSPPPAPVHTRYTTTGLASELHLSYLSKSYAGLYQCTATNSFGYDHMSIRLNVKELPDTPQNLEINEIDSRSITIKWSQMSESVYSYVLQFKEQNSDKWYNLTMPGNALNARVSSLLPATKYIIRISAVNDLGPSDWSQPIIVQTLEEVPSGPPRDVEVNVIANSFSVSWKPPLPEESNGEILGYEVSYAEVKRSSSAQTKTIKGRNKTVFLLSNLKYHATYEITVKAFNKVGLGPASHPIQQITTQSVPSESPQRIRCSAASSMSLHIHWEIPPDEHHNGIIRGYKLCYKLAKPNIGEKSEEIWEETFNTETTIKGLEKYTNYSVRILAFTDIGDGVKSKPVYCTTAEDLPSEPALIKAAVMTSDSILVVWKPPIRPNGVIISYSIYIEHPNRKIHKDVLHGDQNLRYICRNLKEHEFYFFSVSANTTVGEGPPSKKVNQTPLSRVPARIGAFSSEVMAKIGTRASLDCYAVGLPTPNRSWKGPTNSAQLLKYRKSAESILWLGPLSEHDTGNYSCQVENVFGKDSIVYAVTVLLPPSVPHLYLSGVTSDSISVYWKPEADGGSPITGYLLSYQLKDIQMWNTIELDAEEQSFTLQKLKCGSRYQLFVQAVSSIGTSKPSEVLLCSTSGDVPDVAKQHEMMSVNSTSIKLYLDNWPVRECPVLNFKIAYKEVGGSWLFAQTKEVPPESVTISQLRPATRYVLRISANSEAGMVKYDYTFATRTNNGDIIPIELTREPEIKVLTKLNSIIPTISAALCIMAISACIFVLIRKRRLYEGYKSGKPTSEINSTDFEDVNSIQQRDQPSRLQSPNKKHQSTSALNQAEDVDDDEEDDADGDYEICPYATFSLPSKAAAKHQYLYDQYDYDKSVNGHPSFHKRNKSMHTNKNFTEDIEISCISNQETLPVNNKCNKTGIIQISNGENTNNDIKQIQLFQTKYQVRGIPANRDRNPVFDATKLSPAFRQHALKRSLPPR